jgi:uncharacterized membrane protein YuzA (DUF378 family)
MKMKKSALDWIALILLIIGGLNWGLVGVWRYDLVANLFGTEWIARVIYDLVGLAALYTIYYLFKD